MTETLWRLLSDVRPEERTRFGFFVGLAGLVSTAQTVGLAGAESILLSRLGAQVLPQLFVLASAVTVAGTLIYAGVVGRARNDRLFVVMLVVGALFVFAGFAGVGQPWGWLPVALLCAYFLTQAVLLNHFLTFASDYFDTLASKRLLPLFTLGSSAGGALGGVLAAGIGGAAPELLIAGWGVLLVGAAIWLLAFSAPLRRWRSLGFEEADETSVQGIAASLRYARHSILSRWLVASVVTMVVALFMSQYLYSEVLAERFPEAEDLAVFLGVYLAASNLLEIAVELWGTPLLIRRFGVASTNLVHAGMTVLAFAVLAVDRSLVTAITTRLNREMLDNSLGQPVRNLVYNALPLRLRGRMRAFLEGILHFSAMSVAGVLIIAVGRPDPLWLCALGGGAALLYLAVNTRVRGAYLDALMQQLREGRLDLASIEGLGNAEVLRLGDLWSELLSSDPRPAASAAELAPLLAARAVLDPLLEGVTHPDPGVRLACLEALGTCDTPAAGAAVRDALPDTDAAVRLAALRTISVEVGAAALAKRLEDVDPRVRATAAARLGARGAAVLDEMMRSQDPAEVVAALGQPSSRQHQEVSAKLEDLDPRVREAAFTRFAQWGGAGTLPRAAIEGGLADGAMEVRRAAVQAADTILGDEACVLLARALDDPSREVRSEAAPALAERGELGVAAAEPYLRGGPWTVDAALSVLGRTDTPRSRTALRRELRIRVSTAWENLLSLHALAGETETAYRFLSVAHGDALARNVHLAFRTLRYLEGADILASIDRVLRLGSTRARADALELLSNLGDRGASGHLALLLEPAPLEDRLQAAGDLNAPPRAEAVLERAAHSPDRWVRMAHLEGVRTAQGEETMERLLALKQVPLFARLSLDQLESVNRAMTVEHFARGDIVVREDEPGNCLYLILEGEIEIWKGWGSASARLLRPMRPVSVFGEMAVLHEGTRTATAVASEDSLLTSLDGDRMKELILRMPEISFVIFGELIQRAEVAEASAQRAEDRLLGETEESGGGEAA